MRPLNTSIQIVQGGQIWVLAYIFRENGHRRVDQRTGYIIMQLLSDLIFSEMFPIVVAINIWGASLKNKNILFHSDNQAVVAILNKTSSKSERGIALVRNFGLFTLKQNILFRV